MPGCPLPIPESRLNPKTPTLSDDLTVSLTNGLHLHLGTLTLGASPAQNLDDPREGDAGLVHAEALLCNTDNPSDPP